MGLFRKNGRTKGQGAVTAPSDVTGSPRGSAPSGRIDREIQDYIDTSGLNDKVLVEDDGRIIAQERTDRRLLQGLASIVDSRLGGASAVQNFKANGNNPGKDRDWIRYVSPMEFSQLAEARDTRRKEKKSGSEQAEDARAGHVAMEWVLNNAIEASASDIYIDIRQDFARLSFKTFGQVAHIKDMAKDMGLSIARGLFAAGNDKWQEMAACDTSFSHQHEERLYRVRCNSLPDTRGQSVACRVRDPGFVLPLEQSGYSDHQIRLIRRICRAPGGMILITGETNSGKSTTLAGLMLNAPRGQRMIEIADPVEVHFDHCTHVEINRYGDNPAKEFNAVLGATVRQDPDALVLGEIRDEDTADAAQSMAIQGKRVYSTLHTQSCVASIPRLQNLGVDHHLLSLREFLAGVVNQNLVPLVCPCCRFEAHPDNGLDRHYREIFGEAALLVYINPDGCDQCINGVVGQTLVAEVYPLCLDRKEAHQLIARNELWKLEDYMKEEFGIQTKQEHAMDKVRQGLIDPDRTEAIIGEFSISRQSEQTPSGRPHLPSLSAAEEDRTGHPRKLQ